MVSNASDDLPDPETPLTTVSFPWGISQEMFFRLCVRAPRIMIASFDEFKSDEFKGKTPERIPPAASLSPQQGSERNRPFFIIGRAANGASVRQIQSVNHPVGCRGPPVP